MATRIDRLRSCYDAWQASPVGDASIRPFERMTAALRIIEARRTAGAARIVLRVRWLLGIPSDQDGASQPKDQSNG